MAEMDDIIASGPEARVLVEVPLLYEVGWEDLFDTIVVVHADYDTCMKRLMARDSITRAEAVRTLESQMDLSEKVMRADHVVNNSGVLPETDNQLKHLAALLTGN
jgi:dephospho-CoA kinase